MGVRHYQNPDGSWKSAGNKRRTDTGVKSGAKARPSGGSGGGSKKKDISGNPKAKKDVKTKEIKKLKIDDESYGRLDDDLKHKPNDSQGTTILKNKAAKHYNNLRKSEKELENAYNALNAKFPFEEYERSKKVRDRYFKSDEFKAYEKAMNNANEHRRKFLDVCIKLQNRHV